MGDRTKIADALVLLAQLAPDVIAPEGESLRPTMNEAARLLRADPDTNDDKNAPGSATPGEQGAGVSSTPAPDTSDELAAEARRLLDHLRKHDGSEADGIVADMIAALLERAERLTRWKAEATEVIGAWERVDEALGCPAELGESRAAASEREALSLRAERDAERAARVSAETRTDEVMGTLYDYVGTVSHWRNRARSAETEARQLREAITSAPGELRNAALSVARDGNVDTVSAERWITWFTHLHAAVAARDFGTGNPTATSEDDQR